MSRNRQVRICWWMNCCRCGELEADGNERDDAGSDLLKGDDAKTEMIEKVKIVVMPGGKVETRLGLEC